MNTNLDRNFVDILFKNSSLPINHNNENTAYHILEYLKWKPDNDNLGKFEIEIAWWGQFLETTDRNAVLIEFEKYLQEFQSLIAKSIVNAKLKLESFEVPATRVLWKSSYLEFLPPMFMGMQLIPNDSFSAVVSDDNYGRFIPIIHWCCPLSTGIK